MIIIGNEDISFEVLENIKASEDIKSTKPNSTLVFAYNISIMQYCMKNGLRYAVVCKDIKESIFASNLEASYIIINKDALEIQNIAQNYMFDAKILQVLNNENELDEIARNNIDGIIYKKLLEGII
jgi:hypothetical protein